MSVKSYEEAVRIIASAVRRGRGAFELMRSPRGVVGEYVLLAGSHEALQADRAHIVGLTLTPAQVRELRDDCNALLGES